MPPRRLWFWSLVAFLVLAALAAVRTRDWSYGADTGTFVQIVLDPVRMWNGVERTTHYRFHWSPGLTLLWPLLAADRPLAVWTLQAVLAAATVLCAPLLYAIARPALGSAPAERAAYVALVYPPLVAVGFGEFRELGLLPPLALAWWLALERRAWPWTGLAALLLASLREDVCLELTAIGAAVALTAARRGDRPRALAAAVSAAIGALSGLIYAALVIPRVGPWPPSHFYVYPFAAGPAALLAAPFTHTLAFVAAIATLGRLTYVAEAFIPLALLPFRSRLLWLALPGFAVVLLANSGLVWRMGMHYAALWIPWVLIAFAGALAALRFPRRWATAALALSCVVLVAFSPLHPAHYLRPSYHALDDARRALGCVPGGGVWVATHDEWYSALSGTRPGIQVIGDDPNPARTPVLFMVVAGDFPNATFQREFLPKLRADVARRVWVPVCRSGAVTAYKIRD